MSRLEVRSESVLRQLEPRQTNACCYQKDSNHADSGVSKDFSQGENLPRAYAAFDALIPSFILLPSGQLLLRLR
jgi:hypothetical protein